MREKISPPAGVESGDGTTPLPKIKKKLNENGVFWCTKEHCFKVNARAKECLAPDVYAPCVKIFRKKICVRREGDIAECPPPK